MRIATLIAPSLVLFVGCAAGMKLDLAEERPPAKPASCEIEILRQSEGIPSGFREIGDIYFHDTGFSTRCSQEIVLDRLHREACAAGADAANIYRESFPNFWTTCYRVKAQLLQRTAK
jgi:hypothetical protein